MIICVDFDGTIVEQQYPKMGKEIPGAIDWLRRFTDEGAKIILWTMRSGKQLKEAVKYLEGHNIVLYGINENPSQKKWTSSPKAYGNLYIDDAAFGCPLVHVEGQRGYVNWKIVGPKVLKMLKTF